MWSWSLVGAERTYLFGSPLDAVGSLLRFQNAALRCVLRFSAEVFILEKCGGDFAPGIHHHHLPCPCAPGQTHHRNCLYRWTRSATRPSWKDDLARTRRCDVLCSRRVRPDAGCDVVFGVSRPGDHQLALKSWAGQVWSAGPQGVPVQMGNAAFLLQRRIWCKRNLSLNPTAFLKHSDSYLNRLDGGRLFVHT